MKPTLKLALSLFLAALSAVAANDAPNVVNYQGKLLNSAGANVADGTYTVTFKLYGAATGATFLWGESHAIVISAGYFNVMLGEGGTAITGATYTSIADALGNTATTYLGVTITADANGAVSNPSEITPRLRFLSSPYALIAARTKYADTAASATNSLTLGGLAASSFLQPATVTATTLSGPLNLTSATVSQTLTVAGATTLSGNLTVGGTLAATANTTGGGFVPVGGIIMWSGTTAPAGWHLCDGTGTYTPPGGSSTAIPDLRDKFIVGSGNSYAARQTGGAASVTLTTDQLPDFRVKYKDTYWTEAFAYTTPDNGPDGLGSSGSEQVTSGYAGSHATDSDNRYLSYVWRYSAYMRSTTSSPAGAPTAVATVPPYYALAFIIRTQ